MAEELNYKSICEVVHYQQRLNFLTISDCRSAFRFSTHLHYDLLAYLLGFTIHHYVHENGRYLPLFASAVYDQNTKLLAASMTPVNLSLVMIGNVYFIIDRNLTTYRKFLDARGLLLTSLTNRLFEKLSASVPRLSSNYSSCNLSVNKEFLSNFDMLHHIKEYAVALLERGVQFLIYAGTNDWIGNHIGNERSTLGLEWSGQQEFAKVNTLGARASSRLSLLMVPGIW
ncbi:hypothetical protein BDQ17DRAFT_1332608 [Cyathus striatus]|nr:hypothetical protein BDQ17DRAFT_1332608 [Cyathus striatus]